MNASRLLTRIVWIALAVAASPAWGADPPTVDQKAVDQKALEQKFAEDLTGATLIGNYSVDGRKEAPSEDRYRIAKVTKLEGDLWRFDAQIIYGENNVTLPLPLTVKWAGDTPVITLTDMTVPGLGTYTARVLFYRGRYAGTWSASDHGGEMWGRIEKAGADDKKNGTDKRPADAEKKSAK